MKKHVWPLVIASFLILSPGIAEAKKKHEKKKASKKVEQVIPAETKTPEAKEPMSMALSGAELKLMNAYHDFKEGHLDLASTALAGISKADISENLAELYPFLKGEIAAAKHQNDEAMTYWKELAVSPESPFFEKTSLKLLPVLKAEEKWKALSQQLETLRRASPKVFSDNEWDYEIAMATWKTGDADRALPRLKALYLRSPQFERTDEVETALEAIAKTKGTSLAALFTAEEWKGRLAKAVEVSADEAAAESFHILITHYKEALSAEYRAFTEAELAFEKRDYATARALFQSLFDRYGKGPKGAEILAKLATSVARAGNSELALKLNRDLMAKYPKSSAAAQARYKTAFLTMDKGDFKGGRAEFAAIADAGVRLESSLWYAGWCAYQIGDYAGARGYWSRLAVAAPKQESRAKFWQGMSLEKEGKGTEALALYQSLADTARIDYYGFLSLFKLQRKEPTWRQFPEKDRGWWMEIPSTIREITPKDLETLTGFPATPIERKLALYIHLGIEEGIPYLLRAASENVGSSGSMGALNSLVLATSALDYNTAFTLAFDKKQSLISIYPDFKNKIFQFAYPRAFEREAKKAVAEWGISESLIYSIMRQESTFRPTVRSSANAIGLMQLIPPTAKQVAGAIGMANFSIADLKEPAVNIRMGSFYLKKRLDQFNGTYPFAIASYNAGPEAVSRWLKSGGFGVANWIEFVESIPYKETQEYVRRVMANIWMYKNLYSLDK